MFSEKLSPLGQAIASVTLVLLVSALGGCGERILVGTQPAEAPSEALSTSLDAGTERAEPPPRPAADQPDSDGDDDEEPSDGDDEEPSDGDDEDSTELGATD